MDFSAKKMWQKVTAAVAGGAMVTSVAAAGDNPDCDTSEADQGPKTLLFSNPAQSLSVGMLATRMQAQVSLANSYIETMKRGGFAPPRDGGPAEQFDVSKVEYVYNPGQSEAERIIAMQETAKAVGGVYNKIEAVWQERDAFEARMKATEDNPEQRTPEEAQRWHDYQLDQAEGRFPWADKAGLAMQEGQLQKLVRDLEHATQAPKPAGAGPSGQLSM